MLQVARPQGRRHVGIERAHGGLEVNGMVRAARIDHVHTTTLDYRRTLTEQLLKLNQMLERMKRRQLEELERQVKELRVQSNQLKSDDE